MLHRDFPLQNPILNGLRRVLQACILPIQCRIQQHHRTVFQNFYGTGTIQGLELSFVDRYTVPSQPALQVPCILFGQQLFHQFFPLLQWNINGSPLTVDEVESLRNGGKGKRLPFHQRKNLLLVLCFFPR